MYTAHIAIDPQTQACRIQTCTEHSRATAELAKDFLVPCGLGSAGYLAGLLHDCGKFTDEFNTYLEKASRGEQPPKGSVIHTFAGVSYLLKRYHAEDGRQPVRNLVAELLAVSVGGHHGLIDLWDERHQSGFDHRTDHQPAYDERAIEAFHASCASEAEVTQHFQQAEQEISQFYMQKLGSYVRSQEEAHFALSLLARLLTSAVVDADRTDTRCFMEDLPHPVQSRFSWDACVERINTHIAALPGATAIQQARGVYSAHCAAAAQMPPGLYRLDLPTGGGKTLAALRFAVLHAQKHSMQRIYYIAPLLSIIEQNAEAIRIAVGDTVPVLEHHSNIVKENYSPEKAQDTEFLQETWDAPMIVTTFVQFLDALFSGKMASVRRFHALCNSVIIIDEVQSLPLKMLSMFNCAVNFLTQCCGTTVVLCSATQPAFDNKSVKHRMLPSTRLISEALYNQYAPLFRRTEITDSGLCSLEEITDTAASLLESSNNLLIVCNTKREASRLYEMLKERADVPLFHLSAGMCMAHRKQVLRTVTDTLQAGEKLICVSTQVIEAGIDISFSNVIRLSAGLDSIVQAAGRCNRHGEHDTPQPVHICRINNEKLGPLREIRAAQDALNSLLAEYKRAPERYEHDLASAAAVHDYYAFLYKDMHQGAQDFPTHGHTLFELLSTNLQFLPDSAPRYCLNQAFRTAGAWFEVFDSANESILTPFQEGENLIIKLADETLRYDPGRLRSLLEQAKPYSVSVTANQIEQMMRKGMLYTLQEGSIYVLNKEHYDNDTGIKEGNDSCSTLIL